MHAVGQKFHLSFSVRSYGKTNKLLDQPNNWLQLENPIICTPSPDIHIHYTHLYTH